MEHAHINAEMDGGEKSAINHAILEPVVKATLVTSILGIV